MSLTYAYRNLVYRLYRWQLTVFGNKSEPKLAVLFTSSILICINCGTLIIIFQIVLGHRIQIDKIYAIAFSFAVALVNYVSFFYGEKFPAIIEEFSSENDASKRRGMLWCGMYVTITLLSFFLFALFLPAVIG